MKLPSFKSLSTIAWFFFWLGALTAGLGLLLFFHKLNFLRTALPTVGRVVSVAEKTSKEDNLYSTKIRFTDQLGITREFSPRYKSNPARYPIGETIDVVFNPVEPNHAEINNLLDMWLLEIVFGSLGSIFMVVGSFILIKERKRKQDKEWLLQFGAKVKADFSSISPGNLTVNGKQPNIITCQYHDLKTDNMFVYVSENIWFNPEPYLPKDKRLTVWIDPKDPKRYHVDLSFLPKQVN